MTRFHIRKPEVSPAQQQYLDSLALVGGIEISEIPNVHGLSDSDGDLAPPRRNGDILSC